MLAIDQQVADDYEVAYGKVHTWCSRYIDARTRHEQSPDHSPYITRMDAAAGQARIFIPRRDSLRKYFIDNNVPLPIFPPDSVFTSVEPLPGSSETQGARNRRWLDEEFPSPTWRVPEDGIEEQKP